MHYSGEKGNLQTQQGRYWPTKYFFYKEQRLNKEKALAICNHKDINTFHKKIITMRTIKNINL